VSSDAQVKALTITGPACDPNGCSRPNSEGIIAIGRSVRRGCSARRIRRAVSSGSPRRCAHSSRAARVQRGAAWRGDREEILPGRDPIRPSRPRTTLPAANRPTGSERLAADPRHPTRAHTEIRLPPGTCSRSTTIGVSSKPGPGYVEGDGAGTKREVLTASRRWGITSHRTDRGRPPTGPSCRPARRTPSLGHRNEVIIRRHPEATRSRARFRSGLAGARRFRNPAVGGPAEQPGQSVPASPSARSSTAASRTRTWRTVECRHGPRRAVGHH
jgi:hypothetical protein